MPGPRGSGDNGRLSQQSHPARGAIITSVVVRAKAIRGLDAGTLNFYIGVRVTTLNTFGVSSLDSARLPVPQFRVQIPQVPRTWSDGAIAGIATKDQTFRKQHFSKTVEDCVPQWLRGRLHALTVPQCREHWQGQAVNMFL